AFTGRLSYLDKLHHRPGESGRVLREVGGGLPQGAAAVRHPGQLVDPQAPRRGGSLEGVAADRARVVADVRAVAEPDRGAVALAAAGRLEVAPAGRRLESLAGAGAGLPRPIPGRLAAVAGVRRAARQRSGGSGGPWAVATDLERQHSSDPGRCW